MKIALLTIWHEKNYGAELQAYATIKTLTELGHEVKMIDMRLENMRYISLKGRVAQFISIFTPGEWKFRNFWRKTIPKTRRYLSLDELKKNPPLADLYLVGSDQVWNPEITKSFATAFFLDFGDNTVKRASYASSFGVESWNEKDKLTKKVNTFLQRFDAVSCREKSGCEILKKSFNINATHVIDPTLLRKDFSEFVVSEICNYTLVYYPLDNDPELRNYANKLSQHLGYKCIDAANRKKYFGKIEWNRNSPKQWIEAIANSRLVITRSFHGVAFSLLYKRQFIVVNNTSRITRITNLLESLGLSDRCFHSFEEVDAARPWDYPIDYNQITPLLENLREESMEFLKKLAESK